MLKSDQVKRMRHLETENSRLRKAIADLTLDKLSLNVFPRRRGKLDLLLTARISEVIFNSAIEIYTLIN